MHQEQAVFSRVAFRDIHCFAAQEPAGTRSAAERRPIEALCFSPVPRRTMEGNSSLRVCMGLLAPLHGHAAGTEPPEAANPVARAAGFLVATALLHPLEVGIGCIAKWPMGWSPSAPRVQSSRRQLRRS